METYLRLMFLKFRYRLGYESLCREVSDSMTWRQFCRIGIDLKVPHPTSLMKLTTRCGSAAVDGLNEALLAKAVEGKVVRTAKIRVDTTVIPRQRRLPDRFGVVGQGDHRIAAIGRRIQAAGGAVGTRLRDRSRAAGKLARDLNAKLRTRNAAAKEEALAVVRRKNAELAKLAETTAGEAQRLLANAKRAIRKAQADATRRKSEGRQDPAAGRRRGRRVRAVNDHTELLDATRRIAAQNRQRLAGTTPDGATRRVSLHDPDARPIAKGRLGKPVEFGAKAQVCDNVDGIVLDHDVQPGNPADAPRLKPAVERVIKRTKRKPCTVAVDRGYSEAAVDDDLADLGVANVVIPGKGRPTKARQAHERGRSFRQNVKWRTGCEGRINHLKRSYGCDRT